MAIASVGFEATLSLIDRGSNKTTRGLKFAAGITTQAMAVAEMAVVLAAFANVSDLAVTGYRISEVFEEDALVIPTLATAEISTHAEISGLLEGFATKRATIDIPGPQDDIFVATTGKNYNIVNMVGGGAAAIYASLFSSTANLTLSDGEQFAQPVPDFVGKRTHSKSRTG